MLPGGSRPLLSGLAVVLAPLVVAAAAVAPGEAPPAAPGHVAQAQPPNPDAEIVADFLARVAEYQALREKIESTLSPLPSQPTPEEFNTRQHELERLIRRARPTARPGDLLTPPVRAFIRRQLARALQGPEGDNIRESIMADNPRGVRIQINGRYPDGVPLSTVPPQVLLLLPRLPDGLEYRFVGQRLLLLDAPAKTVIDYMDNALRR
ncbi:MAG TPA: hypothetical protein VLD67_18750 [Vicinamibacterales bacterium]|nr:hypothetical protein [Vicinamibacterales bacterium]